LELNVAASEYLAKKCNELGCKMIYISTDYVFDGTQPPYETFDSPNPLNQYGKTKLQGLI
jgi:S-adenosylmethionine synthetase